MASVALVLLAASASLLSNGDFSDASANLSPECRSEAGKVSLFTEDRTWNRCGKCEVVSSVSGKGEHAGYLIHAANVLVGATSDSLCGLPVEPGVRYDVAFDLKGLGSVGPVKAAVAYWVSDELWNGRRLIRDFIAGDVVAGPEWRTFKGSFVAPEGAKRAALRLEIWSSSKWPQSFQYSVGDGFLFDNVRIAVSSRNLGAAAGIPAIELRKALAEGDAASDLVVHADGRSAATVPATFSFRRESSALIVEVEVQSSGAECRGKPTSAWTGDTVEIVLDRPNGGNVRTHVAFNDAGAKYTDAGEGRGNADWTVDVCRSDKSLKWKARLPFAFLGLAGDESEIAVNFGHGRASPRSFDSWVGGGEFRDPSKGGLLLFSSYAEALRRKYGIESEVRTRNEFDASRRTAEEKMLAGKFEKLKEARFSVAPVSTISDWSQPYLPEAIFDPPREIRLSAAINEIRALPIAVANLTDRPEDYRVILETTENEKAGRFGLEGFPSGQITIRRGVRVRDVKTPDPSTRFDPLPLMDEGGFLSVPPKEAGLVWIDFDCTRARPGVYRGRLRIVPLCEQGGYSKGVYSGKRQTLPVTLVVVDAEIPMRPAKPAAYFGRASSAEEFELAFMAGAEDFQVNTWAVRFAQDASGDLDLSHPLPEFTNEQQRVRNHQKWAERHFFRPKFHCVFSAMYACWDIYGGKDDEARFRRVWPQYLRGLKRLMNGSGVPDEDYFVEVYDEPSASLMPRLTEAMRMAKLECPTMRLGLVLSAQRPPLDDLKSISQFTDVWDFWQGAYFGNDAYGEWVKAQKASGREIRFYKCDTSPRSPLLQYYRHHAWFAEKHALDGADMYIWADGGDRNEERVFQEISYGGLVFRCPGSVVPSLRLMALREGVTDAKFLEALRRKRSRGGDPELCAFVDSAVGEVLSKGANDIGAPDRWREKARELLRAAERRERR